jgi:C-terminal processing protease CtpA/Prc
LANLPDFDVVGLILKPEDDGRYTILGTADLDGKPSVPTGQDGAQAGDELIAVNDNPVHGATLGAVWSLLGGTPGQERVLTIERAGKQFTVTAQVQHFLAETPDTDEKKGKHKR